ncbi:FtsB family cell division protein [Rubrivirga sp.]|uniref:FtsB family cell division protein n=1 Tax=Rubrivirga sp. TaxID=1885344 RepID=UPI003B52B3D6
MTKRLRRNALLLGLIGLGLWVAFFDSHSVYRRASYAHELDRLTAENEQLAADNRALAAQLDAGLDDALLEEVAREEYGMRRPGERVYRVEAGE